MTNLPSKLKNHLTVVGGTVLILNIILGSGLLILPALTYRDVGNVALYSWLVVGIITFPILLVVIELGKKYPSAGGVPHYAKMAFGKYAQLVTSLLFLGAVSLGLPSISLTGGYYVSDLLDLGLSPHLYAVIIIAASALLAILNVERLKRVVNTLGGLVIGLIVLYIVLCGLALLAGGYDSPAIETNIEINLLFTPFMMIFFSFAGWEIASHLTEEFQKPKRDFPIAMIVAFLIVIVLYLLSAWLVQTLDISSDHETAFTNVVERLLGQEGSLLVPVFAFALVFANIFGATWAVSRLMYYLSLEEYIPQYFSRTRDGIPVRAVVLTSSILLCVVGANYLNILDIEYMFTLAGQNFFVIYGVAAASLWKLNNRAYPRVIAASVLLSICVISYVNSNSIQYPVGIFILAAMIHFLKRDKTATE